MRCPACHVLTLGKVVCPVCNCDFLNFRLRQPDKVWQTGRQRHLGWGMGTFGRGVLMAALLLTLSALPTENHSTWTPNLLALGLLGSIAGMLLVASGHSVDLVDQFLDLRSWSISGAPSAAKECDRDHKCDGLR